MAEEDKTSGNLPNIAVEYIDLVVKKMRYRKKARDEVREELVDHFETSLKNCASNDEKEQKARQLISEFGDAKLLAALMRRAKKRCRPMWRTVVARSFQALGILVICLILYVIWFFTGKPVITTNYIAELNNLVRPSADDSLNAATFYNKAIEALVDVNDGKELLRTDFYDANDRQKNLISRWLAKNEEALALAVKGTKLPYCWQHYESKAPEQSLMSVLLPNLAPSRQIAYALCWRAWLNAQASDFNSAFQDIDACYRLGMHHKGKGTLIEQLVGMAIEGRSLQTIRQMLNTCKIESGVLADFQRHFQTLIDSENFKPDFSTEKLLTFDEIQRSFTESRFGPSHIYPKRILEISGADNDDPNDEWADDLILALRISAAALFSPNKTETVANTNAFYEIFNENLSETPARLKTEETDLQISRIVNNNIFLKMMVPALARVTIIAFRNKIDAESTAVVIALVRYQQDTGDYPETLDKLKQPGFISQIPIDPFSDIPLSYKKTDKGPLLYSWGGNLTDDNGQVARDKDGKIKKFADEGDWVFWPVE